MITVTPQINYKNAGEIFTFVRSFFFSRLNLDELGINSLIKPIATYWTPIHLSFYLIMECHWLLWLGLKQDEALDFVDDFKEQDQVRW